MPARHFIIATALAFTLHVSAQEKITYADHVRPLLENKCFSCHNPDKKKGDLDLTSFAGTMAGGGSGSVINSGDPDGSKLIGTLTKKVEPYMPPEGSPLGAKEIEVLSKWIQGGVLETASSIAKKSAPRANLTLAVVGKGKPEGPPPMPENVLLEPVMTAPRTTAVTALAASQWAPLVAVSGLKQALVYDMNTLTLSGIYPYPEGYLRSLKFSQNGTLLVGGGGRGGKNGNAVVWDVKSGKRITEVGKEFDQVMCADISPNHSIVAIGSPSKKVKVYDATSGEEKYIIKKHTEWVLQLAFSPDGVLLASADRNGGVLISEAATGGEFYSLEGHKVACTGLAWRSDGNLLASCGEDGKVFLWEMENGKSVKSWDAQPGGCLSVNFTPDGRIITCGRDGTVKVWDVAGKKLAESKSQGDLVTKVAALFDNKAVISGDWAGNVKVWGIDNFDERGALSSNPSPLAQRIIESEKRAAELIAQLPNIEGEVKTADVTVKAKEAQLAEAKKQAEQAAAYKAKLEGDINATPGQIDVLKKTLTDAQAQRQAQIDVLKKHEQTAAQVKQIEPKIAALEKEFATLTADAAKLAAPDQAALKATAEQKTGAKKSELDGQKGQLDPLKKAIATAPKPLSDFDVAIKSAQDQITALTNAKPVKTKELEGVKKALDGYPKNIADIEKQIGETKAAFTVTQAKLESHKTQIAFMQKQPINLRAAQFNVGLLTEKEALAKLEGDVTGYKEANKDADAAKIAAGQRIEASKKFFADATTKLPELKTTLLKIQEELPPVEKILDPTKALETQTAGQLDAQQKMLGAKEAEVAALTKEKTDRIAAATKSVEDINKQMAALQKQLGEVSNKAEAPVKQADGKKAALAKSEGELGTAKQKVPDAMQVVAQKTGDLKNKEVAQIAAHQATEAAQNALPALRDQQQKATNDLVQKKNMLVQKEKDFAKANAAGKPDQLPPVQKAVDEAKGAVALAEKIAGDLIVKITESEKTLQSKKAGEANAGNLLGQAKLAHTVAETALKQANGTVLNIQNALNIFKTESENAEKIAAPLRAQLQNLTTQIDAQKKSLGEKQAEPGNAEKDFAAKSQPVQAAIAQIKSAITPLEKQLADARVKLAADSKIVEAKRADVAKAQGEWDAAKKAQVDSQKTIDSSTKEIATKDQSIVEIKGELAKMEPQLQPQRDKVKKLTDQYFAMLPK